MIDDSLPDWSTICDKWPFDAILIGNGASIRVHSGFDYSSLLDMAELYSKLTQREIAIFGGKRTSNFEEVLAAIDDAILIDLTLHLGQSSTLSAIKNRIRSALFETIKETHVTHAGVGANRLELISDELKKYRSIYTTNYDLLLYWAINKDKNHFYDYFWNGGLAFDPGKSTPFPSRSSGSELLYLHGGIHLATDSLGTDFKISSMGPISVIEASRHIHNNTSDKPLFITEGSSAQKLNNIYSSKYLKFAFNKLEKHSGNLVVLGHSLSQGADDHILDAIAAWPSSKIAIGVWNGVDRKKTSAFKFRMRQSLERHDVMFFDFDSHPLSKSLS